MHNANIYQTYINLCNVNRDSDMHVPVQTTAIYFISNFHLKRFLLCYVMVDFICMGLI